VSTINRAGWYSPSFVADCVLPPLPLFPGTHPFANDLAAIFVTSNCFICKLIMFSTPVLHDC